jgi:hypothetical protein
MGIEPMTSPLPRECSTAELHQPYYGRRLLSADALILPKTTRTAKKANRIQTNDLYLPGSIVCQAEKATTPIKASAIHILPLEAGLRSKASTSKKWCTGKDSNLRNH